MSNKQTPPARSGQAPAAAPPPPAQETTEPRKRASLSMEKRLAIALASVLAVIKPVIESKQGAGLFKEADLDTFKDAAALAGEINQKTLKPIEDRLTALNTEIAAASKVEALTATGGAKKLGDLVKEMTRLQGRKANLIAQASAAPAS